VTALSALRRFVAPRPAVERCALCAAPLVDRHPHLAERENGRLACACEGCALLFSSSAARRYRRLRSRLEPLPDFRFPDDAWGGLDFPVNLAFLVKDATGKAKGYYPSPAGPVGVELPAGAWERLAEANPVLAEFEPGTDALLVDRTGAGRGCFRASLDECYRLVGLFRLRWRAGSGGAELNRVLDEFFAGGFGHE
jgi:hypothetical protein